MKIRLRKSEAARAGLNGQEDGEHVIVELEAKAEGKRLNAKVADPDPETSAFSLQPSALPVPAFSLQPSALPVPAFSLQPSGPGTELKKLLALIGITAGPGCRCHSRAREMDVRGPDWCAENLDLIVGWLAEEAAARKLPFMPAIASVTVKRAIRRSRKLRQKNSDISVTDISVGKHDTTM